MKILETVDGVILPEELNGKLVKKMRSIYGLWFLLELEDEILLFRMNEELLKEQNDINVEFVYSLDKRFEDEKSVIKYAEEIQDQFLLKLLEE